MRVLVGCGYAGKRHRLGRRIEMRHGSALCRFVVIVVQPVYFAGLHQSKSARFRCRMTPVLNDGRADFGQVTAAGVLLAE